MSNYRAIPIRDIGKVVTGKTPATSQKHYYNGQFMFITPTELHDGYNIITSEKTITAAGLKSIITNSIDGTSVLVGCIGWDMGNVAMCHTKCATNQQINSITNFKPEYNPYYVYYWLSQKKEYLFSIASVTRTPILSKGTFEEVCIPMPPKEIQDAVVDVLQTIDEKIFLNKQICAELESMAKTIYDYWFTQFNFPDAGGKPYCSSGGAMEWNEQLKRKIPLGWCTGQLSDIANITMGQSPAGETYNENGDGKIFYQGCTDFGTRFPVPRVYTTAPTRFANAGDILMSVRAPVGTLNVAIEDCSIGRGLAALNSKMGSQLYLWYTLAGFKQLFNVLDGNGTTFGSITKDTLYEMKVVIPESSVVKAFEEIVQPIEQKIRATEQENRELTKLRDWLLPMLMNGQATVE